MNLHNKGCPEKQISAEKDTEKSYQEYKKKLDMAIEAAGLGFWEWDIKNGYVDFSKQWLEMLGYNKGELPPKPETWTKLIHPDDKLFVFNELKKHFENESYTYSPEFRMKTKDGNWKWINARGKVFERDKNNKPIMMSGVHIDITEEKKIYEEFKKGEVRYRELFNNMGSGVAVYEATEDVSDFIVKDINYSATVLSNVRKKNIIGKKATEAFPGIREFGLLDKLKRVFKDGIPRKHPLTFYKDNHHQAWFENYVYKLVTGEIVAIYDDVTARVDRKNELINSRDKLEKLSNLLHKNLLETVNVLARTVEYRDVYTAGHSRNVSKLACAIAGELGLQAQNIEALQIAGTLHDIGKIAIPTEILNKTEPLTEEEYDLIKTHPAVSYKLVKNIEFQLPVATIIYQHHERINGSGYPLGKKGTEILLESKILAVADVIEGITLSRPYRGALGIDTALEEISDNSGILYDRQVVRACIKLFLKKNYSILK
ncbi:MAG: PAS domain-containing protein [Victivallales bacterium]|nr:PAS domain-containing protein [Victivallales bacterium]